MKSVEIEFKTMITEKDFLRLQTYFQFQTSDFHLQENHYYDTEDARLRKMHWGLRIRLLADHGELTLKTPLTEGLLETTDRLSLDEAHNYVKKQQLPTIGTVADYLIAHGLSPEDLRETACLKTSRAEGRILEGLLALDESWYGEHHDFELELEVVDAQNGAEAFQQLLKKLEIPYIPAQNKILRALSAN